jgi:hypothetical protein
MDSDTEPPTAYDIGGQRWLKDAPGFAEAIAHAVDQRMRPRCLCRRTPDGQGIEMYVARLMNSYIVKRMPYTGHLHAITCPSYEPPADFSGLGPLLGTAIVENPATGETNLKLDFPMTKLPGRSTLPTATSSSTSAASQGQKLGLRALLHYLWDQAELTHWHPGFAGKRNWSTVRRHLHSASTNKFVHGCSLMSRLYIPEVFSVDQREAINTRRLTLWTNALAQPGKASQLMLLIGEVKEFVPSRYGLRAVIKHVPDQAFAIDERLYRQMERRFAVELEFWGTYSTLHMVMIATFSLNSFGIPAIVELTLMPVSQHWLPVEDSHHLELVERLVREHRSFVKCLSYNCTPGQTLANSVLTDISNSPVPLVIFPRGALADELKPNSSNVDPRATSSWVWYVSQGVMPEIPKQQHAAS